MKKWLDRHIGVDWKTPGAEFLGLFADSYPELEFLNDDAFESLIDDLANASPDECFDSVAIHLDSHGYTLWSLDPGGDTYLLAIVPRAKANKVVVHWCGSEGEIGSGAEPLRLGPAPSVKPPTKRARKAAPDIVEELISFEDMAPSIASNGDLAVVYRSSDGDDRPAPVLWNVAQWPAREMTAPQMLREIAERRVSFPIYGRSGEYWWYRHVPIDGEGTSFRAEIVRIGSLEPYSVEVVHDVSHGSTAAESLVQGCGPCVFLLAPDAQSGHHRLKRYAGGSIAATREDVWFESTSSFAFLVLSADSVVVYGGEHGPLWLSSSSRASQVFDLPDDIDEVASPFAISSHEFAYFTQISHPNPEDGRFTEDRLQLHRVDVRSGRRRSAVLEDLVTDRRVDFLGAGKIRYRTFCGHLRICPGHGPWKVLNFVSRQHGKKDHAWLWNTETDEVLRFGPDLFPRLEPSFMYLPAAGRYVAETTYKLRRLAAFELLRPHLKAVRLDWVDQ